VLAGLAVGRARKKTTHLVAALDGTFTDHHGWMCRHYLDQIEHLDGLVGQLDQRIADRPPATTTTSATSTPCPVWAAAPRR
jgi:hypothetical protein